MARLIPNPHADPVPTTAQCLAVFRRELIAGDVPPDVANEALLAAVKIVLTREELIVDFELLGESNG